MTLAASGRDGHAPRVIAVDWSGARTGSRSKIWLAEARRGELVRLESGRSRDELVGHLIDLASSRERLIAGLDFAFSFPAWFVKQLGCTSAEDVWARVAQSGDEWLKLCKAPFWGRPGKQRPDLADHFRLTERIASEPAGSQPKSVFQVGGAGAVGTASLRGMPYLALLRDAGFSIWPFHEAADRMILEIYPRLLTGRVKKSNAQARREFLIARFGGLDAESSRVAASSEDAFDAAVSALVMSDNVDALLGLEQTQDPKERLEGAIWWPGDDYLQKPASEEGTECDDDDSKPLEVLGREQARHFRNEFREARLAVLADSEAYSRPLHTIERFQRFLDPKVRDLGKGEKVLKRFLQVRGDENPAYRRSSAFHPPPLALFHTVRDARNDAMHVGARARHMTTHLVQLCLILEEALQMYLDRVSDYMVPNPVCIERWQPLSLLRIRMLENSFSFIPIHPESADGTWELVSDHELQRFLGDERKDKLALPLGDAIKEGLVTTEAKPIPADSRVRKIRNSIGAHPLLVESEGKMIGILTAFDLL